MSGNTRAPVINATWMDRPLTGVLSVEVEDHDQLIDKATIVLEDGGRLAPTQCYSEEKVKIEMGWDGHTAVLFEGIVVEGGGEHVQAGSQARMVAYDFSVRMHREHRNHLIPANTALSALVREVASRPEYGFAASDINIDLENDPQVAREMADANLTDLQFLQKLAGQYQCRAFVEYNSPAGSTGSTGAHSQFYFWSLSKIMQRDPAGTLYFCPGMHQLQEFHYHRVASGGDPERTTTGIDIATGTVTTNPTSPTPGDPPLQMPEDQDRDLPGVTQHAEAAAQAVVTETAASAGQPNGATRRTTATGGPADPQERARATQRDPTRVAGVMGEGQCTGNIDIRAKSLINIIGISPWYEGAWYVKVVRHRYERSGPNATYTSRFLATR